MLAQYAKLKGIGLGNLTKPKYLESVMKNMVSGTGILYWQPWDTAV